MRIKKYVVFFLLIVILILCLPLLAGMMFKRTYMEFLTALGNASGYNIQVKDYREGWFSSGATLLIDLKEKNGNDSFMPTSVTIEQHITHGPYLMNPLTSVKSFSAAAIQSQVHFDDRTEKLLLGSLSDQGVAQIDTVAGFFGGYQSQLQTPGFTFKVAEGETLNWKGLNGTMNSDVSGTRLTHMESDFVAQGLKFQSDKGTFSIAGFTTHSTMDCATECESSGTISIPGFNADQSDGRTIKIGSMNYTNSYTQNKKNDYKGTFQLVVNNLVDPDYTINLANIKIDVTSAKADALKKYIAKIQDIGFINGDTQAHEEGFTAAAKEHLPKIFTDKTSLNENIRINTTSGNFVSEGKMTWPQGTPVPDSAQDLVQNVTVKMNLRAATTLVELVMKLVDNILPPVEAPVAAAPAAPGATTAAAPTPGAQLTAATTRYNDELSLLSQQKMIPDKLRVILVNMLQQFTSPHDFSTFVNEQVTVRILTVPTALVIEKAYLEAMQEHQRNLIGAIFADPAKKNKELQDKTKALSDQGIITPDAAQGLIDLQNQMLAPEVYAVGLHRFVTTYNISSDLEIYLRTQYAAINKELSLNKITTVDTSTLGVGGMVPEAEGRAETALEGWIKKGFVKLEKEDYVVIIDYSQGVLKLNGVQAPMPQLFSTEPGPKELH